jgi:hypothetical protein
MCWNIASTFSFSIIYLTAIYIHYSYKRRNYQIFILFNLFFCIMELFQMCQWLFADVTNTVFEAGACSKINKLFTYFGFILVWLQPLLFSMIPYLAYKKKVFINLSIINLSVFFLALGGLIYVTEFNKNFGYTLKDATYGSTTCTYIGASHHLAWSFSGFHADYQANHLLYFVLCCIAFSFYKRDLFVILVSWLFSLFLAFFVFSVSLAELPSFWCVLSVLSNIFIFVDQFYLLRN